MIAVLVKVGCLTIRRPRRPAWVRGTPVERSATPGVNEAAADGAGG